MQRSIYMGYDSRETESFAVARHTLRKFAPDIPIHAIELQSMRDAGLYWRPTSRDDKGRLFDDISEFPMSTEFAISRFLTPVLAKSSFQQGWALFMDCDVLARDDIDDLFAEADPSKAVMCVQHRYDPPEGEKMDGQAQLRYARKNWSSVMLFNLQHPANRKLNVQLINTVPGRDLHRFCWLDDADIGALGPEWNYLIGHTQLEPGVHPKMVHFTEGGPWFEKYRDVEHAAEWQAARAAWLSEGMSVRPTARVSALAPRRLNGALAHTPGDARAHL